MPRAGGRMEWDKPKRVIITGASSGIGRKIVSIIERGKSYAVIPWQMAIVARTLGLIPDWLYDRLFANAPRKPRRTKT